MTYRSLVYAALAAACLSATATGADAPQRPNFVVLVADDLGYGDVGYYGSPLKTPHIDRLAGQGLVLDRHYVATMCSPTRAALITGRYWSRFGVTGATNDRVMRFDTVTLARALKSVGYETALVGKWHLGSRPDWGPQRYGFDHSYGSLAGGVGPYTHRYKMGPYSETWHRNGQLIEEQGHVTDLLAAEAVRWIESRGRQPFFLYVPFTAVHIPIDEPSQWLDLYPDVEPATRRHYAASASHMDHGVGRIVAALENSGRRDNTLIVFFSDNGATPNVENNDTRYPGQYLNGPAGGSNRPLRGQKSQVYEGGCRVPAVVSWPGKIQPGKLAAAVHVVDWMPTLCALAGYQPQSDLGWDGTNLAGVLLGRSSPTPRTLYCAGTGFRSAALWHGDWKLVVHRGDGPSRPDRFELYDVAADPGEQHDLAAEHPQRVDELKRLLDEQSARDHDAQARDSDPQAQ